MCYEALSDLFTCFSLFSMMLMRLMFGHLLPGGWKPRGNYYSSILDLEVDKEKSPHGGPNEREGQSPDSPG